MKWIFQKIPHKDHLYLQNYDGGNDHGFQIGGPKLEVYR